MHYGTATCYALVFAIVAPEQYTPNLFNLNK